MVTPITLAPSWHWEGRLPASAQDTTLSRSTLAAGLVSRAVARVEPKPRVQEEPVMVYVGPV